jgi:hypothetical protein
MINQSQRAGDHSTNIQASHIGDYHIHGNVGLVVPGQANYLPIAAPDRYIEESAMGKVYSLLAKDALVTDVTHFDKKAPGSKVTIKRTTIRGIDKQGKPIAISLPGDREPPCAVSSSVVVVDAKDKNDQSLAIGVLEKGIGWNYYPALVPMKRWKYWRFKEGVIISVLGIILFILWFLKIYFPVQFYYQFSTQINSTNVLYLLTIIVALAFLVPVLIRQEMIRKRMQEFAQEASTEVSTHS